MYFFFMVASEVAIAAVTLRVDSACIRIYPSHGIEEELLSLSITEVQSLNRIIIENYII